MHLVRNNFVGKEIRGYRIIKQLANNALGHVYLAQSSVTTNSFVAVKIFTSINVTSQQDSEAFLQEAQFLTTLKQQRLLPVVEYGVERGHPFLITPYVPGGSLRRRMKEVAPRLLPLTESVELISRIGFVLATLHRRNILHCDLRPENVLFIAEKDVALCDPGLASILEHVSDRQTLRELSTYFAPEQISGNVTAKSDQYALGCITYELLTGKLPPTPSSLGTDSSGSIMRAFVAPSRINSALPSEVDSVLFKAMAVRPENRYDNVMLFVQALRAALPEAKRRQSIVTQRLDATDVAADLAVSKTLHEPEQKRDVEPDAPTEPEQKVVEERKNTKLVRAFPIIAINKNRRRFPPPPWLLLLLFALLLVGVLTLSPLLRGHSPSVTYRPTPTLAATKIASIPGVVPTATATPKPRITPTVTSLPSLAPRKTPSPSPTVTPTSPPIAPTQAPPEGGPALIQGVVGTPPATVNLTNEGTRDWIEWGAGDANSVNRKAGVEPQISSYTEIGNAPYTNSNGDIQFSWYDGTPNSVVTGATNGVETSNGGFQITVPAGRATRVLRIYTSVTSARCIFGATLSGGGSYNDASLASSGNPVDGVYTIYFRATSDNQTLTVTLLQINGATSGFITLEAATLE